MCRGHVQLDTAAHFVYLTYKCDKSEIYLSMNGCCVSCRRGSCLLQSADRCTRKSVTWPEEHFHYTRPSCVRAAVICVWTLNKMGNHMFFLYIYLFIYISFMYKADLQSHESVDTSASFTSVFPCALPPPAGRRWLVHDTQLYQWCWLLLVAAIYFSLWYIKQYQHQPGEKTLRFIYCYVVDQMGIKQENTSTMFFVVVVTCLLFKFKLFIVMCTQLQWSRHWQWKSPTMLLQYL